MKDSASTLKCANLTVETALVTSGLVLVDQALTSHVIENRYSVLERCFSSRFVTFGNCGEHTLDLGAHHRTLAGIALTAFLGLTNSLTRLCGIGHGLSSNFSMFAEQISDQVHLLRHYWAADSSSADNRMPSMKSSFQAAHNYGLQLPLSQCWGSRV